MKMKLWILFSLSLITPFRASPIARRYLEDINDGFEKIKSSMQDINNNIYDQPLVYKADKVSDSFSTIGQEAIKIKKNINEAFTNQTINYDQAILGFRSTVSSWDGILGQQLQKINLMKQSHQEDALRTIPSSEKLDKDKTDSTSKSVSSSIISDLISEKESHTIDYNKKETSEKEGHEQLTPQKNEAVEEQSENNNYQLNSENKNTSIDSTTSLASQDESPIVAERSSKDASLVKHRPNEMTTQFEIIEERSRDKHEISSDSKVVSSQSSAATESSEDTTIVKDHQTEMQPEKSEENTQGSQNINLDILDIMLKDNHEINSDSKVVTRQSSAATESSEYTAIVKDHQTEMQPEKSEENTQSSLNINLGNKTASIHDENPKAVENLKDALLVKHQHEMTSEKSENSKGSQEVNSDTKIILMTTTVDSTSQNETTTSVIKVIDFSEMINFLQNDEIIAAKNSQTTSDIDNILATIAAIATMG